MERCLADGRPDLQTCTPILTSRFTVGLGWYPQVWASFSLLEIMSIENRIHVMTFFFVFVFLMRTC